MEDYWSTPLPWTIAGPAWIIPGYLWKNRAMAESWIRKHRAMHGETSLRAVPRPSTGA